MQQVATVFANTREWQTKGPLRFTLKFDAEQAEYYWHEAFGRYADWGARRKLVELGKLHPCLKQKSRVSTVPVTRGGRANARSRFKENAANEQRTMTFG